MNADLLLGNMYQMVEEVSRENALKLNQILDLEDILYTTRLLDMEDGSPCWCCLFVTTGDDNAHDDTCVAARQATCHLWESKK